MKNIFLGPKNFWIALIIVTLIIFSCGLNHMHVSVFNLFISIVFITTGLLLFFILKNNKK